MSKKDSMDNPEIQFWKMFALWGGLGSGLVVIFITSAIPIRIAYLERRDKELRRLDIILKKQVDRLVVDINQFVDNREHEFSHLEDTKSKQDFDDNITTLSAYNKRANAMFVKKYQTKAIGLRDRLRVRMPSSYSKDKSDTEDDRPYTHPITKFDHKYVADDLEKMSLLLDVNDN